MCDTEQTKLQVAIKLQFPQMNTPCKEQTSENPRPFGMPPFAQLLSDGEVAAVVTHR